MDSGGYTYVHFESNGQKGWAAVPKTQVKVGDAIIIHGGGVMNNFTSKTLGRTFESILFGQGIAKQ